MNESTLEQYFIEDYKRLKDENDELKGRLAVFEANAVNHEYGITDLHQRSKAVKGDYISSWYVEARLNSGDLDPDKVRAWLELDDDNLFSELNGKSANYTTILEMEEHEFQYTLMVKESRTEWVAMSDGKKGSNLIAADKGELCECTWFPADRADDLKAWLLEGLRDSLEKGLRQYEEKKGE